VGLDHSTYYDIKFRKPNDREIRRLLLADAIADIHARSRGTYGILRVRAALEIEQGLIVNTKLVKRIMRELGLQGLPGPKKGYKNLQNAPTCEDLVQRQFTATRPNELWLTDITERSHARGFTPPVEFNTLWIDFGEMLSDEATSLKSSPLCTRRWISSRSANDSLSVGPQRCLATAPP
jgi:transposase InsO family protein